MISRRDRKGGIPIRTKTLTWTKAEIDLNVGKYLIDETGVGFTIIATVVSGDFGNNDGVIAFEWNNASIATIEIAAGKATIVSITKYNEVVSDYDIVPNIIGVDNPIDTGGTITLTFYII